jgi:hypothetical protein
MTTQELSEARAAVDDGRLATALDRLEDARRDAAARRDLHELAEVWGLVSAVHGRAGGWLGDASERLAQAVGADISGFSPDELAAAGVDPDRLVLAPHEPAPVRVEVSTPELERARSALARGDFGKALYELRDATRVAVAQRRHDELLEVQELVRDVSERSSGRTREASEALARKVEEGLSTFDGSAADAAAARLRLVLDRQPAADRAPVSTRELVRARSALDQGDFGKALYELRDATSVAIAQRKLDELLAVHELVGTVTERSSGRTRQAGEALTRKVEAGLSSFA